MVRGVPKPAVDLEDSTDRKPWGLFQKLSLILAALASAVDGWANQLWGWIARGVCVRRSRRLPRCRFGHGCGGFGGDRLGRRVALIGSVFLFGAATSFCSQARSITVLGAIRFIDGMGLGGAIPNGAALVSEFTPLRRRSLAIGLLGDDQWGNAQPARGL